MPGVPWPDVLQVALVTRETLEDFGLVGWPKTSGSRGFHVYCRIERQWTFPEVRRAAVALAREVERRAPEIATSRWWKEERHGVFLDYNQNAKDRTVASAYSVRPTPDARVSMPLSWDEVPDCRPEAFTIDTVPELVAGGGRRLRRDRRPGRVPGGAAGAGRPARGGRVRRRPLAAPLRQGRGRAGPGPALQAADARPGRPRGVRAPAGPGQDGRADRPPPHHHAPDRDRPGGHRGRGPRGPGALEGPPRRRLAAARPDRRAGRLDAGPQHHLVPDPAQPPQRARGPPTRPRRRSRSTTTPGPAGRPGRGRPRTARRRCARRWPSRRSPPGRGRCGWPRPGPGG